MVGVTFLFAVIVVVVAYFVNRFQNNTVYAAADDAGSTNMAQSVAAENDPEASKEERGEG